MTRGSSRLRSSFPLCLLLLLGLALPARAASPWVPRGEELAVNTRTSGSQWRPAVASDRDGNTFVAWMDSRNIGLKGRAYDASGAPVTGEIRIEDFSGINLQGKPRVAVLGPGDFIVTWGGPNGHGIKFRRFNALGQPLSDTLTIYDEPLEFAFGPDVAADPAGGFILCWSAQSSSPFQVLAQRFDSFGAPRSGAFVVSPESGGRKDDARIAVDPVSGRFMVTWIDGREDDNPDVWARRFNGLGQPLGPELLVNTDKGGEALGAVPVFHDDGFSVVWSNFNVSRLEILAQRFDAAGSRVGGAALLSLEQDFYDPSAPAVAVAPGGGLLVLWAGVDQLGPDAGVRGRLFDGAWRPAGEPFEVNTYTQWSQTEPSVAVDGRGNFMAVWSSGETPYITDPQIDDFHGQDGSSYGVYGQRFSLAGCAADGDTLCLNGGRFAVRATWKNPFSGQTGIAHSHPLAADTGALWFFDPANLELMIKVLDARAVNGHYWVFYGALSDVEYTVTVTDTRTGAVKTYHNPAFQLSSRADVSAFAEAPPAGLTASSAAVTAAAPPPVPKAGSCVPTATALCLAAGRFAVEVVWTDPRIGLAAQARALPVTADTGVFWFVDATNLELMIKVLDGRGVNGHFWVFYGALSDLEYTITVTDTETGQRRTYHNARNNLASRSDVTAF